MSSKAKHAYGKSENLANAIETNKINEYDILFLDGDTEPKIGWVDSEKNIRIVQGKAQVIKVDELPTVDGDENVVYIYNNEGYIWDSANSQCVSLSKSADLSSLETQVSDLETQMDNKVDASAVQEMVNTAVEAAVEEATSGEVVVF